MAVHRYRSTDREVAEALHDADREIVPVDHVLDIAPGRSRLHPDHLACGIEPYDLVHAAHVDVQRIGFGDLPAHAETPAADRYRSGPSAQRRAHLVGRAWPAL